LFTITNLIKEGEVNNRNIVKQIVSYLKKYYTPAKGMYKDGGEYHNTPVFKSTIDEEEIIPENLLRHLQEKFPYKPEFLQQVIRDFYDGKITTEYGLSKNLNPS
jgi:hypothetical protein